MLSLSLQSKTIKHMKNNYLIFTLLLIGVLFLACNRKNNCEDILCTTGPSPLFLQFINPNTSENLIETGVIGPDNLDILDINNIPHDFKIILTNSDFYIRVSPERFGADPDTNYLFVNDTLLTPFIFQYEIVSENCCSFPEMTYFDAFTVDYDVNYYAFTAKIYIEN